MKILALFTFIMLVHYCIMFDRKVNTFHCNNHFHSFSAQNMLETCYLKDKAADFHILFLMHVHLNDCISTLIKSNMLDRDTTVEEQVSVRFVSDWMTSSC